MGSSSLSIHLPALDILGLEVFVYCKHSKPGYYQNWLQPEEQKGLECSIDNGLTRFLKMAAFGSSKFCGSRLK